MAKVEIPLGHIKMPLALQYLWLLVGTGEPLVYGWNDKNNNFEYVKIPEERLKEKAELIEHIKNLGH